MMFAAQGRSGQGGRADAIAFGGSVRRRLCSQALVRAIVRLSLLIRPDANPGIHQPQ